MSNVSRVAINLQYSKQNTPQEDTSGTEYLWGRIVFASAAFLVIVVLLSWLFYKYLTADQPSTNTDKMPVQMTQSPTLPIPVAEHSEPTMVVQVIEPDASEQPRESASSLESTISDMDAHTDETRSTVLPQGTPTLAPLAEEPINLEDSKVAPIEEAPTKEHNLAQQTLKLKTTIVETSKIEKQPSVKADQTTKESSNTENRPDSAELAKVSVFAPSIVSARLSPRVENRSVLELLVSEVVIPTSQVLKVHFVTEYQGLKDQWIYHDWYRNNTLVVRVKSRPQSNKMLAFSSKNIDATMYGSWQVKVVNDKNILLALGEFTVRRAP